MRQPIDLSLVIGCYLVFGLAMLGPALVSVIDNEHSISQSFFYCGLLTILFSFMAQLASLNRKGQGSQAIAQLAALVIIFLTVPAIAAVPIKLALEIPTQAIDLYFEMVSCLTTTGASVLQGPIGLTPNGQSLPMAVIFWRAEVAWLGGLLIWLAAAAIFLPLGIGGFETTEPSSTPLSPLTGAVSDGLTRRGVVQLSLIYVGLTVILWLLLLATGEAPIESLIAAMSTLSTSGITLNGGFSAASHQFLGEFFICVFFVFALSRWSLSLFRQGTLRMAYRVEREWSLAFLFVLLSLVLVIFFHYKDLAATRTWADMTAMLEMMWGYIFSVLSFLTTTGFRSIHWESAVTFQTEDFVLFALMGMALIGGGVATTASGLKLLRVERLLRFGATELSHLAYPSSVPSQPHTARNLHDERFVIASIFVMSFFLLLALFALLLTLGGCDFVQAFILSISSLTNTGPLANAKLGSAFFHGELSSASKIFLCVAMIIGRLELLALLSLLNPRFFAQVKTGQSAA